MEANFADSANNISILYSEMRPVQSGKCNSNNVPNVREIKTENQYDFRAPYNTVPFEDQVKVEVTTKKDIPIDASKSIFQDDGKVENLLWSGATLDVVKAEDEVSLAVAGSPSSLIPVVQNNVKEENLSLDHVSNSNSLCTDTVHIENIFATCIPSIILFENIMKDLNAIKNSSSTHSRIVLQNNMKIENVSDNFGSHADIIAIKDVNNEHVSAMCIPSLTSFEDSVNLEHYSPTHSNCDSPENTMVELLLSGSESSTSYSKNISPYAIKVEKSCETSVELCGTNFENDVMYETSASNDIFPISLKVERNFSASVSSFFKPEKESCHAFSNDQSSGRMICDESKSPTGSGSSILAASVENREESTELDNDSQQQSNINIHVKAQVWNVLAQAGFANKVTESVVDQVTEMLKIGKIPTEEQLKALLGTGHPAHNNATDNETEGDIHSVLNQEISENEEQSMSQNYPTCRQNKKRRSSQSNKPITDTDKHCKWRYGRTCKNRGVCKCPSCIKAFSKDSLLIEKHTQLHININASKIECHECGMIFATNSLLKVHIRTHTGEKPNQCPTCGKVYTQSSHLLKHIKTHSGQKTHKCSTCEKTFNLKSSLKRHMKIHSFYMMDAGEKPYECSTCGKKFFTITDLQRHNRTHTVEKPFKCLICVKSFTQKVGLNRHTKSHTGETPYKCSVCGFAFARKCVLQKHIQRHTCKKLYECPICKEKYYAKSRFEIHVGTHNEEKPFKCTKCCKSFKQNIYLQKHFKSKSHQKKR